MGAEPEARGGEFSTETGETVVDRLSWIGRYLVLLIGLLVAGVMFAISGVMNFRFGMTLGSGAIDPWLYGFASLTADGFKALLPFIVIGLWRARQPHLCLAGLAIWCLCVAWSMASAMGFATSTRDLTVATRDATNKERAALEQRAERLESQIALLPAHRPAGAVRAAIANADVPRNIWNRTAQCTDVTIPESLTACQPVLDLRKELAIADDAATLEAQLLSTRQVLGSIAVIGEKKDPQAETISGVLGLEPERVRSILAVLITLLIEAGSSLGFTLVALGAGMLKVRRIPVRVRLSRGQRRELRKSLEARRSRQLTLGSVEEVEALTREQEALEERITEAMLAIEAHRARRPNLLTQPDPVAPPEAPQGYSPAAEKLPEEAVQQAIEKEDAAAGAAPGEKPAATDEWNQDPDDRRPEDESQDPGDAPALAASLAAARAAHRASAEQAETTVRLAETQESLLAEREARQNAELKATRLRSEIEQAVAAKTAAEHRESTVAQRLEALERKIAEDAEARRLAAEEASEAHGEVEPREDDLRGKDLQNASDQDEARNAASGADNVASLRPELEVEDGANSETGEQTAPPARKARG